MELKSLILGLLMSSGAFALKSGMTFHCLMGLLLAIMELAARGGLPGKIEKGAPIPEKSQNCDPGFRFCCLPGSLFGVYWVFSRDEYFLTH